ncbi:hypothetical protein GC194_13895 [bacterium]|nr:hypothetical protein [bacterium]
MKTKNLALALLIAFATQGCWYDNEEDMYPSQNNNSCVTDNMSFTSDIVPILTSNSCISCHNASMSSSGVNLDGYDNVKPWADNGRLYGSVNHDNGYFAMPQGLPKIDQCQIDKLKAWIDQGTTNN